MDFSPAFGNNTNAPNANDPWGTNGHNNTQKGKLNSNNEDTDSDDFFPPLPNANGLNGKTGLTLDDPWATPSIAVNTKSTNLNDPWKNNNNNNNKPNMSSSNQTNPWLPNSNATAASNVDPWNNTNTNVNNNSSSNKQDDFDFFTSNRVKTPSSPVAAQATTALDPFEDLFASTNEKSHSIESSTNPWTTTTNENSSSNMSTTTMAGAKNNSNGIRKTPESFLGENSSLVNLENLIPSRPKSTNPFGVTPMTSGLSSSTSSGQLNNPFAAQQGKPSIK